MHTHAQLPQPHALPRRSMAQKKPTEQSPRKGDGVPRNCQATPSHLRAQSRSVSNPGRRNCFIRYRTRWLTVRPTPNTSAAAGAGPGYRNVRLAPRAAEWTAKMREWRSESGLGFSLDRVVLPSLGSVLGTDHVDETSVAVGSSLVQVHPGL